MSMGDIASPKRTLEILDKYNLRAKKSLGQNFIIDTNILNNMVDSGNVDENTVVIEIGPGIGALTEQIAKKAKYVYSFEIDSRLLPVLDEVLSDYDNITIIEQDFLQVNFEEFKSKNLNQDDKVVIMANLPYYITTPIIMNIIESGFEFDNMVFMMQKEVGNRLAAQKGTKEYGSLSIAIQYYVKAETMSIVPNTVFIPQPNVDSAIIRLTKKEQPEVSIKDDGYFFKVVRSSFKQRRKTIWNNLKNAFGKDEETREKIQKALDDANIEPNRRGESLGIDEFAELSDNLYKQKLEFID